MTSTGTEKIERIKLKDLKPSPFNPREISPKDKDVIELAESIRQKGVMVPLIVNRGGSQTKPSGYWIIAGHRRFQASKLADLADVPCIVKEWTNQQVRSAQLVENLQRKDLHPMEEAWGWAELIKSAEDQKQAYTIEDAAKKTGKSVAYIRQVVQLMKLIPDGQKAYAEGKIGREVAFGLSRLPNKEDQAKALKEILGDIKKGWNRSVNNQLGVVENFLLQLSSAPFDVKDATLYAKAGPCTTCPKRAGNQAVLFEDVDLAKDDRCTDGECFKIKTNNHVMKLIEKVRADGCHILASQPYDLLQLEERPMAGSEKKWSEILEGCEFKKFAFINKERGTVYTYGNPKDVISALKVAGKIALAKQLESGRRMDSGPTVSPAQKLKEKIERETLSNTVKLIVGATSGTGLAEIFHNFVLKIASEDTCRLIGKSMGWSKDELKTKNFKRWTEVIHLRAKSMNKIEKMFLAASVIAVGDRYPSGLRNEEMPIVLKSFGLDLNRIRKTTADLVAAQEKAKSKPKVKKDKKGKGK